MTGLDIATVRTVGLVAAVAFVAGGIGAAILLRSLAQKAAVAAILLLLATLVWSQRAAVDECVTAARAAIGSEVDVSCTFFGRSVSVTGASVVGPGTGSS